MDEVQKKQHVALQMNMFTYIHVFGHNARRKKLPARKNEYMQKISMMYLLRLGLHYRADAVNKY